MTKDTNSFYYDVFDNPKKVRFILICSMAATIVYEIALFQGVKYVVNTYKTKTKEITINQQNKKPDNPVIAYHMAKQGKII